MFVIQEFFICYNERGMVSWLQVRFTYVTKRQWKVFVVNEIHISYKEKCMEGICCKCDSNMLKQECMEGVCCKGHTHLL